jgi:tetratricopeptide (TPR) repeat protein
MSSSKMSPVVLALALLAAVPVRAQVPQSDARVNARPPWQRRLEGADARTAAALERRSLESLQKNNLPDAIAAAKDARELRLKVQGARHWQVFDAAENVDLLERYAAMDLGRRRQFVEHKRLLEQAIMARSAGRFPAARQAFLQHVESSEKIFGKEDRKTAQAYDLAFSFTTNAVEAEHYHRAALAIFLKTCGENHPDTASCYAFLAKCLNDQRRPREAEVNDRAALRIRRWVLGEEDPLTMLSYNNLAFSLQSGGRPVQAEAAYRRLLTLTLRAVGPDDLKAALVYNNLGGSLYEQGRGAEAYEQFAKALEIRRRLHGENHEDIAVGYLNLAGLLDENGERGEAERYYKKVSEILSRLPDASPRIAGILHQHLGAIYAADGKYDDAVREARLALAVAGRTAGPESAECATLSNGLAIYLNLRGNIQEAEAECRRALGILERVLGDQHPQTSSVLHTLAVIQIRQGRYDLAEKSLERAAIAFAKNRITVTRPGLDGAGYTRSHSPLLMLAAILARNGKPDAAWERFEQSLGRSTWDEITARSQSSIDRPNVDRAFKEGLSLPLSRVQSELADHEALAAWIDIGYEPNRPEGEHWAVVVRSRGEPAWMRLGGSGAHGEWTRDDADLPNPLMEILAHPRGADAVRLAKLINRMKIQRIDPIRNALAAGDDRPAVKNLIVLPSAFMVRIPIELLIDGVTVSYTPSATVLTYLRERPPARSTEVLALGDPLFARSRPAVNAPPLPSHGLLLDIVSPKSNASKARPLAIASSDVLLSYNHLPLRCVEDLQSAMRQPHPPEWVRVELWRDGTVRETDVPSGDLGVIINNDPAPIVLAERRKRIESLAPSERGGRTYPPLAGSRFEVGAISKLFTARGTRVHTLVGSEASEQRLNQVSRTGDLGKVRYLHLATHGVVDSQRPMNSAMILCQSDVLDPFDGLQPGTPVFDGRLTAGEVVRDWRLDAEMVTLSACGSGLGKHELGEGFVGFSQAFLLAGSRSVCLTLWATDDVAAALLMRRFYENLLGAHGLKDIGPMAKAPALSEAKKWLRDLTMSKALAEMGTLSNGVVRGDERVLRIPGRASALPKSDVDDVDRPFAHPYYWAPFILVGDPT